VSLPSATWKKLRDAYPSATFGRLTALDLAFIEVLGKAAEPTWRGVCERLGRRRHVRDLDRLIRLHNRQLVLSREGHPWALTSAGRALFDALRAARKVEATP